MCDIAIITTEDHFKDMKGASDKIFFLENPQEIIEKIKSTTTSGPPGGEASAVVLLEGRVLHTLKDLLIQGEG